MSAFQAEESGSNPGWCSERFDRLNRTPYKDKQKQAEYQREWIRKRREAWLAENGPCAQCGSWEDLEVDHVDPQVKVSHNVWSWSAGRREAELAKCQVLCEKCHKKKTKEQSREETLRRHNPPTMYRRGCRCELCKEYQRVRNRRRYAVKV